MTDLMRYYFTLFTENWRNGIIILVNGLLSLLIIATLIYEIFAIYKIFKTLPAEKINPQFLVKHIKTRNANIAQGHLFGRQKTENTAENTQWTVRGIIFGKNGKNLVVIASSPTDESIYKLGDTLVDGSIIFRILSDRVLLSHNGRIEILYIPWNVESAENLNCTTLGSLG